MTDTDYSTLLNDLFIAFNEGDLDKVMSFFAQDAVFEPAGGTLACGDTLVGVDSIRTAFANVYKTFPDIQWKHAKHHVLGELGLSQWVFSGTRTDGYVIEANGVDVFEFAKGKITKKSAYRKECPLIAPDA